MPATLYSLALSHPSQAAVLAMRLVPRYPGPIRAFLPPQWLAEGGDR